VLDLTAVDRVDSTGLGMLVGALKRLRARNGQLRLAAATSHVARLLHATGLDKVLPPVGRSHDRLRAVPAGR